MRTQHKMLKSELEKPSPSGRGAGVRVPITLARALRQNQTDAERKLWYLLRNRHLGSYKFKRQYPIGNYIADFCCMKKRLVIELDGGQHAMKLDQDMQRTYYLNRQGYRVIRFWNNDVLTQTKAVLETILKELRTPLPLPSPQGEGIFCSNFYIQQK